MFRRILFAAISRLVAFSFLFHPDILTMTAGISLFLFGMLCLEQGFRQASGGLLAKIIKRMTHNNWSGYSTGVLATALLQSSSLSSVITVSFVSTGLISLTAGLSLVIGSGLGSTLGTWLIAGFGMKVTISHYAMPLLVIGTLLQLQSSQHSRSAGYVLLGIGFLFLGIHYIRTGMAEAGDLTLLTSDYGLWGGILVGTLLTIFMQSSHALLVLVIAAMANNLLSLDQALALCIGTNIGTTATALLAAISATNDGRRLALGNLMFKLAAAVVILLTLPVWQILLQNVSISLGIGEDPLLQLALFHSFYNLLGAILTVPFLQTLVQILNKLIPKVNDNHNLFLPLPKEKPVRARLLTSTAMEHPDAAMEALKIESGRLYQHTIALIGFGLYVDLEQLRKHGHRSLSEVIPPWPNWQVGKLYKLQVRSLYEDVTEFADKISSDASVRQKQNIQAILIACENFISAIKQLRMLQKNLRKSLRGEHALMRQHYLQLRKHIISTIHSINQLAEDGEANITDVVHALKRDLHKQDLLTGDSLAELLKDEQASPTQIMQLINDNGTAHNICNNLIDGAVILLLQGERAIIQHGTKPPSKKSARFWESHHWNLDP